MGRQTTAKADERRRRKQAKTSVSASAPTRPQNAGATAATKPSGVNTATKAPAAKPGTTVSASKASATKSASAKKTAVRRPTSTGTSKPVSRGTAAKAAGAKKPVTKSARASAKSAPGKSASSKSTQKPASVIRNAWNHLRGDIASLSAHPLTTYFLILVCVVLLTGLGLVMVLSASSITSYDGGAGSSFAYFNKQAMFAGVGLVIMFAASRMSLQFWERTAWFAILGGLFMQALVFAPGLGKETKGNANWIGFGGFQIQPSEFLKVALALWLGFILAKKAGKMNTFGQIGRASCRERV